MHAEAFCNDLKCVKFDLKKKPGKEPRIDCEPFAAIRRCNQGFTLVEIMIVSAISVVVIGGATMAMVNAIRGWRAEAIRSDLHMDLEIALTRIQHDLRLSSVGEDLMAFYPMDGRDYTAISFPLATPGANGLLPRDENNKVIWDTTVIYHVRPGTPDELIRTTFHPRNPDATAAELREQLVKTVTAANSAQIRNEAAMIYVAKDEWGNDVTVEENVESWIMFRNLVEMLFRPPEMRFDGYAPEYQRARRINWGSLILSNGVHDLTFTVLGQNTDSTGHRVGIDRFALSRSRSLREAEMYLPSNNHPVTPFYEYTINRGDVIAEDMSVHGAKWGGNSQLTFRPPTDNAIGSKISFRVENDLWCDANFDAPSGVINSNCSRKIDRRFETIDPNLADFVVSMDNLKVWDAVSGFTSDQPLVVGNLSVTNSQMVNVIHGGAGGHSTITMNGSWVRFELSAGTDRGLIVRSPQLSRRLNDDQSVAATEVALTFNNGANTAVFIAADQSRLTDWLRYDIDRTESYLLQWERMQGSWIGDLYDAYYNRARIWINHETDGDGNPYVMSYRNGIPDNRLIGLSAMEVLTTNAVYRSGVFDTRVNQPEYQTLVWTQYDPPDVDGDIHIRVRSADNRFMQDAWGHEAPWSGFFSAKNGSDLTSDVNIGNGRYLQYEAWFAAHGNEHVPPILRDVTITWGVPTGIVDLIIDFARGPDYGIVTVDVNDGHLFIKGVEVDMEIFREGPYGEEKVSGTIEVRPLNTGR